jgi:hypothetical protein
MKLGPPNKGMKLTSVERIGRSQLIPGVGRASAAITRNASWTAQNAAAVLTDSARVGWFAGTCTAITLPRAGAECRRL